MQINGYGSMAEYYAEMARQKAQLRSAEGASPAAMLAGGGKTGAAEAIESDFATVFAEQARAVEETETPETNTLGFAKQGQASDVKDMLRILGGGPLNGLMSGMNANGDASGGSIFNEMLKTFSSSGSSGGMAYLQNMVKGAYGA